MPSELQEPLLRDSGSEDLESQKKPVDDSDGGDIIYYREDSDDEARIIP